MLLLELTDTLSCLTLGVKSTSTSDRYVGRPLTWSEPEATEIEESFDRMTKTFQEFYGFSKADMNYSTVVMNK